MDAFHHIYFPAYPLRMLRLKLERNPRGRSSPIRATIPTIISMHLADAIFQATSVARQDATKRGGKSIAQWCWRYFGVSRRDQRRLQFVYYQ